MIGARALLRTLLDSGVEACFANPGTSEVHFVSELHSVPGMRGVLGLAEGVVTGAADGYGRMADRPAATLLHLGAGLSNGLANLSNAQRARTPIVNVVGDHATHHKPHDPPMGADIAVLAGSVSRWVRSSATAAAVGPDAAEAVAAARSAPGGVATLILPADVSWSAGGVRGRPVAPRPPAAVEDAVVREAATALRTGPRVALLLAGAALRDRGLLAAQRIAAATGAALFTEDFPGRLVRGAGLPAVPRLKYRPHEVAEQLAGIGVLLLVGARPPAAFFGYADQPSVLVPPDCETRSLAGPGDDLVGALEQLADRVAGGATAVVPSVGRPTPPTGPLTVHTLAQTIGAHLPEGAVVVDEQNTSAVGFPDATAGSPRHDLLTLSGGAVGYGLPAAIGAAVACPDRPVVCMQSDGSAMYTLAALWTHAREGLDITTVLINNGGYASLRGEFRRRVGREATEAAAADLFDLSRPDLDFTSISEGLGVPACSVTTAEELGARFRAALAEPGPHLIEVRVPPLF